MSLLTNWHHKPVIYKSEISSLWVYKRGSFKAYFIYWLEAKDFGWKHMKVKQ